MLLCWLDKSNLTIKMVNCSEPQSFHLRTSKYFWNLNTRNHSHASCKKAGGGGWGEASFLILFSQMKNWSPGSPKRPARKPPAPKTAHPVNQRQGWEGKPGVSATLSPLVLTTSSNNRHRYVIMQLSVFFLKGAGQKMLKAFDPHGIKR